MKKLLTLILICAALNSQAQDTTIVLNQSFQLRAIEYMIPFAYSIDDDVYFKWRRLLRGTNQATPGTTALVTDTIATVTLIKLYDLMNQQPGGYGMHTIYNNAINTVRGTNAMLARGCTAVDQRLLAEIAGRRQAGRRKARQDNN